MNSNRNKYSILIVFMTFILYSCGNNNAKESQTATFEASINASNVLSKLFDSGFISKEQKEAELKIVDELSSKNSNEALSYVDRLSKIGPVSDSKDTSIAQIDIALQILNITGHTSYQIDSLITELKNVNNTEEKKASAFNSLKILTPIIDQFYSGNIKSVYGKEDELASFMKIYLLDSAKNIIKSKYSGTK